MQYIIIKMLNYVEKKCTYFFSFFTKIEKKIFFISFNGKQYSDNQRAISEKMHELFPDYKIVWGANRNMDFSLVPDYVKVVYQRTPKFYKELSSAFCFCTNQGICPNIYKRKNQFFIQTWHGDRGFKKILYQNCNNGERPIPIIDNKVTDLFVIGSDYAEKRIQDAFKYQGNFIKVGMPRNDKLIEKSNTTKIKNSLNIPKDKKILLYAPTFRDSLKGKQIATIDLEETISHLKKGKSDWICLIRAHSLSKGIDINYKSIDYRDVSGYSDMADLLQIADMLITDYSSSAGDFILCRKPVILAWFDKQEYNKQFRSFAFNVEDSGFLIANCQKELNDIIDTMSSNDYKENCEYIMNYFGTHETGNASEYICIEIDKRYRDIIDGI